MVRRRLAAILEPKKRNFGDPFPVLPPDELNYYERRAEAEIALAQQAGHARAVQAHYELASAYLDRIHGEAPTGEPDRLTA